jgi:hypothetical protein
VGVGLLILGVRNDLCRVDLALAGGRKLVYSFSFQVIPGRARTHIQSLGLFREKADVSYSLDEKQNLAITDVLTKLIREKESSYTFYEQLKATYLVELIHIITKIHQHNRTSRFL